MKIKELTFHKEMKMKRDSKGRFVKGTLSLNKKLDVFVICQVCGKEKKIKPVHQGKAKYCSYKCYWKARMGMSPWNKGMEGFLAGEKHWSYGKKRLDVTGSKNHFWKGGVSKTNKTERRLEMQTIEYKLWRDAVYKRDNYTCRLCGQKGCKLEADHIERYSIKNDKKFDVDNGQTLCVSCHRIKTAKENKLFWSNQFGRSNYAN